MMTLINKINDSTKPDSSVTSIKDSEISKLWDSREIQNAIIFESINQWSKELNKLNKELIKRNNQETDEFIAKINKNKIKSKEIEKEFSKYNSTKDKLMILQIIEKLKENESYREETKTSIEDIDSFIKQNKCADFRQRFVKDFELEVGLITNKKEYLIAHEIWNAVILLNFVSIDNLNWIIQVQQSNDIKKYCFLKLTLKENTEFELTNNCSIYKIQQNHKFIDINQLVKTKNIQSEDWKIVFTINLWKWWEEIMKYSTHIKNTIVNGLQHFIDLNL